MLLPLAGAAACLPLLLAAAVPLPALPLLCAAAGLPACRCSALRLVLSAAAGGYRPLLPIARPWPFWLKARGANLSFLSMVLSRGVHVGFAG